jgi:hypothetical protein
MRSSRIYFGLVCLLAGCGADPPGDDARLARLSGYWTSVIDLEPYEQSMLDELPSAAHLVRDTGTIPELPIGDYAGLTLTAKALEEAQKFDPAAERGPSEACDAPSVVYFMQAPFPMEVYTSDQLIVFKMEFYDLVRVVFLDGRNHPATDVPHSRVGHSVGHWEGETLVVETTHIRGGTFLNNGFNHTENIRLTERFRVSPDGKTLWLTQVYEDPEAFAGLAARYMAFAKGPDGGSVFPYDCNPGYSTGYSLR